MKKLFFLLGLILVMSIPILASPIYDDVGEQITVTVDDMVLTPVVQEVGVIEAGGEVAVWYTLESQMDFYYFEAIEHPPYYEVNSIKMTPITNKIREDQNRYTFVTDNDTFILKEIAANTNCFDVHEYPLRC